MAGSYRAWRDGGRIKASKVRYRQTGLLADTLLPEPTGMGRFKPV